jgi:hypothetical protein
MMTKNNNSLPASWSALPFMCHVRGKSSVLLFSLLSRLLWMTMQY